MNPRPGLPPLPDKDMVRRKAIERLEEIARHVWAEDTIVQRAGGALRFGAKGARVVHLDGRLKGRYADWEAGHHGDVFDFWARVAMGLPEAGVAFPLVLRDLARFLGVVETEVGARGAGPTRQRHGSGPGNKGCASTLCLEGDALSTEAAKAKDRADNAAIAMMIASASPADGSSGAAYLASRGIVEIEGAGDLRFLAAGCLDSGALTQLYDGTGASPPRWLNHPALLCLARDRAGEVTGVQRILLTPDGQRAARVPVPKPATGRLTGAAFRLPQTGRREMNPLLLAEGPETALSLWQSTGFETRALLGGFGGLRHAPKDRTILLCQDADPLGSAAAEARAQCLERLRHEGCDVRSVAPPGQGPPGWDFNDVLCAPGLGAPAIQAAVEAALS